MTEEVTAKIISFKDGQWNMLPTQSMQTYQMFTRSGRIFALLQEDSSLKLAYLDKDAQWKIIPGNNVSVSSDIVAVVPYIQDNCDWPSGENKVAKKLRLMLLVSSPKLKFLLSH